MFLRITFVYCEDPLSGEIPSVIEVKNKVPTH